MKYLIYALVLLWGILPAAALAQGEPAQVRVVHASPDAPPVDVLVDGNVVFQNVAYNNISDYMPVAAGSHTVAIVPAGAAEPVLAQTTADLEADQPYTLAATGKQALLEPLLLRDDPSLPPPGQARLRFIHLSPNAPAVDLTRPGAGALFSGVPFQNDGSYITINPGTYTLEVQIAGTGVAAAVAPGLELEGGTAYTVFATGLAGGIPALQALVGVDASRSGAPPPATVTPAPAGAVPLPADEGVAPAAMPTTGGENGGVTQWLLAGLGLILVFCALIVGFRASRQESDIR